MFRWLEQSERNPNSRLIPEHLGVSSKAARKMCTNFCGSPHVDIRASPKSRLIWEFSTGQIYVSKYWQYKMATPIFFLEKQVTDSISFDGGNPWKGKTNVVSFNRALRFHQAAFGQWGKKKIIMDMTTANLD